MIGSIHTSFGMDEAAMTERMIAAVEHPWLDAIGHPTGRKIETRPPYAIDMTRVIAAAAKNGTMIEINAAPDRRDMNESHARAAAEAGVMILIDSDAHSARNFDLLQYGIATARRAWLSAGAGGQHPLVGGLRAAAQARQAVTRDARKRVMGYSGSGRVTRHSIAGADTRCHFRSRGSSCSATTRSTAAGENGSTAAAARSA